MYYRTDELVDSLPPDFPATQKELTSHARELGELLAEQRSLYKKYGPYWWTVKTYLKTFSGMRNAWFMKPYMDPDLELPVSQPFKARMPNLLQLWGALRYARPWNNEIPEGFPGELHIIEPEKYGPALYKLQDPDASIQLDLFESTSTDEGKSFFEPFPVSIPSTPSIWRNRGDEASKKNDFDGAIQAYRCMLATSRSEADFAESWLRLAECFLGFGHTEKSVFCYECLMEYDHSNWIIGELGRIYLESGRYGKAFEYYQKAISIMPKNPEISWGYQQSMEKLKTCTDFDLARA